jgi:large-conductance mechanosensitive channel
MPRNRTTADPPGSPDSNAGLLGTVKKVDRFWQDFTEFISQGRIIDLAVGVVMGASFTSIVDSFTQDLISPLLGLILDNKSLGKISFAGVHISVC